MLTFTSIIKKFICGEDCDYQTGLLAVLIISFCQILTVVVTLLVAHDVLRFCASRHLSINMLHPPPPKYPPSAAATASWQSLLLQV